MKAISGGKPYVGKTTAAKTIENFGPGGDVKS